MVALGVMLVTLLTGCATPAREPVPSDEPAAAPPPAVMDRLPGALMTHRAAHGRFPRRLSELAEAGLMSVESQEAMARYAYAAGGLGALPNGRRIIVVDAYIRAGDRAWCIVEHAVGPGEPTQLELLLVPMELLRRAAEGG